MSKSDPTHSQQSWLKRSLQTSIASVDDLIDVRFRQLKKRFGWDGLPRIQPYIGFANNDLAWFHGRVLTNPPQELPSEDDNWWDNVLQMYQRFASEEVVGVQVEIDFAGKKHLVVTDYEGYFHLETANTPEVLDRQAWKSIAMRIVNHPRIGADTSATFSKMLTPPVSTAFGVISDIDDTVLHTGMAGLLTAARLTFLHNARTRKPLPGVAAWYRALNGQVASEAALFNPIFYVSSSPWNLFDLLEDFLELNDIPDGPILLRDLGFDHNKFLKEGHEHKLDKIVRIMTAFPELPFVLIGDSGQEDPQLYAQAAERFPKQIKVIFIRDVDPEVTSHYDAAVTTSIEVAAAHGVPMHLIRDSLTAADICRSMGLIPESTLSQIQADTVRDFNRPQATV